MTRRSRETEAGFALEHTEKMGQGQTPQTPLGQKILTLGSQHGRIMCREGIISCISLLHFGYSDSYLFRMKCLLKTVSKFFFLVHLKLNIMLYANYIAVKLENKIKNSLSFLIFFFQGNFQVSISHLTLWVSL